MDLLPAQKGKGKKSKADKNEKAGVAKFREALRILVSAVGETVQGMAAEAEALRKVLGTCGKEVSPIISSIDAKTHAEVVKKVVHSQQDSCLQLQQAAKSIIDLVRRIIKP